MKEKYRKIVNAIMKRPDYQWLLSIWAILILAWIPAYLALFPGTFGYDAPIQLSYITGERPLSSHHPVMHTWMIGFFLKLGEVVGDSMNIGVAFYTLTQALVATFGIAWSILYTKKKNVSLELIVIEIIFAALNPALQILTFSVTKDIIFGAFLLMFTTSLCEWFNCETCNKKKHSLKEMATVGISGTMMCLLRNQGIYILMAIIIIYVLFRIQQKRLLLTLLIVFMVSEAFFGSFTYWFKSEKGDIREMFSVPAQQLARVYYMQKEYDKGQISQEQMEQLEKLIPEEALMSYTDRTADPVRSVFRTQVFLEEPSKYIWLYFEVGLQNPKIYWQAFCKLNEPYWNISENDYRRLSMTNIYGEYSETYGIRQNSLNESYRLRLLDVIDNKYEQEIPVISWILEPGFGIWIMVLIIIMAIYNRDKKKIMVLSPIILYFLTMILGPVALMRYVYPITLATPLMLGMFYDEIKHARR